MNGAKGKRDHARPGGPGAGEALPASDRLVRELLEGLHLVALTLDAEGRVTFCNDFLLRLTGRGREEVTGRDWFDTFLPEEQRGEVRRTFFEPALRESVPAHYENEIVTRAGERRLIAWNNTLLRDSRGQVAGTTSIGEDITERRRAEEEIKRQSQIIALAPVLVCGLDDRITFWSTGSEQLYGWPRGEALGKVSLELLGTQFPEPPDEIRAKLYRDGRWEGELAQTRRDCTPITVLSQWVLHRDERGQPTAVLIVNTDITEKKKVEAQLLRAQRLESIGTLASGIAHDLNNVLSPVMMALEVLQMKSTDEESRFWLKILEESVGRGAGMVKQVLSFARGTEGRHAPVNLKHLIAEVANIVKETFPKSISITYSAPANLWGVYADPTQFHQVLLNLVVNARDAMPQGGALSVEAENRVLDESYAGMHTEARPGRYVVVTVSDTGVGMPREVVERVFDPFFTTKEPGKGTGLGLPTALTIVKGHGGFMNVSSEPGRGTKFTIYVPAAESGEGVPEGEERAALPPGHGELILVVDDEESIRQITAKTLEAFGYRVVTAGDGTEAVAVYAQKGDEIAVVICDMMMPFMDGWATILALRRMNPLVAVISSSGLADAPRAEEVAGMGVRAFLPKPYTAEALLRALSDILGGGD